LLTLEDLKSRRDELMRAVEQRASDLLWAKGQLFECERFIKLAEHSAAQEHQAAVAAKAASDEKVAGP
jgi:hypothetical protein